LCGFYINMWVSIRKTLMGATGFEPVTSSL
jgi:hypothetical protein